MQITSKNDKKRQFLINVTLMFSSLIFFIILGEIAARIFYPGLLSQQKMFADGDYMNAPILSKNLDMIVYSRMDNSRYNVKTNSLGLRSLKEIPEKKPSDTINILCLGDSFTFGYGVNDTETYPYYLEQILNDRMEGNYNVINAGFADGWGTDTEYLFLKSKIKRLEPDIVLLGVLYANDLYDVWKNKWVTDEKGLPEDIIHVGSRIPRFIKHHSGIYQFLRGRLARKVSIFLQRDTEEKEYIKSDGPFPFVQKTWDKMEQLFLEMRNITEENNAKFIVLVFPTMDDVLDIESPLYEVEITIYNKLREFCDREDFETLDLLKVFKKYSEDKVVSMHIPKDGHWSEVGTKACAEELYNYFILNGTLN